MGLASISLLDCQTSRSWEQGCPGVCSGARYYWDQVGDLCTPGVRPYFGGVALTSPMAPGGDSESRRLGAEQPMPTCLKALERQGALGTARDYWFENDWLESLR